ncbi:dihydroorotase [Methylomarinovum caldicuralii]|uniref:Dihydroorotase n=1 Tax=Methylomarinovum caldicuralii TaxID=438856 RepID=A0AAU9CIF9_9GAMM|nr:dihydroorotase [Methylomarinovum caldicuralii]BCX81391.1 dihydroorotase [Methylomarinovum caldicuralii]
MKLAIVNGLVCDPVAETLTPGGVWIAEGKIVATGSPPPDFTPQRELDARGGVIAPGLIDLSVCLREPGFEAKGTIASETRAAAAGGVTTVCALPETQPVADTPAVIELIRERAEHAARARVVPVGALTCGLGGERLSEMHALGEAGCRAVGNAGRPLANPLVWRRALEYAATYGLTVFVRPQDPWLAAGGCAHEGEVATRLGLPGIPASAETVAVAQILALVADSGARVHFSCLSTARAAAMIGAAATDGLPVSCDVAAHQLHLTEQALEGFDASVHLAPPLRTLADRDGLRRALAEGTVTAVCSDHRPHEEDAKLDVFAATEPGAAGLETLLPLVLALVDEGVLTLPRALARLTMGPAGVLGLEGGRLQPGAPADVIVIDTEARWPIDADHWYSRGRNTPFWGQTLKGKVRYTLVDGRIVHPG